MLQKRKHKVWLPIAPWPHVAHAYMAAFHDLATKYYIRARSYDTTHVARELSYVRS